MAEVPKHQQRPSLISLLTGQTPQPLSQQSSIIMQETKNGGFTPNDSASQNTLIGPLQESSSSISTAATNNKDNGKCDTQGGKNTPTESRTKSLRPSVISEADDSKPPLSHSSSMQQTLSKPFTHKLRFVQSVELRNSCGDHSALPISPESAADESSGEIQKPHRLQRSKAQSRKTLRLKRTQNNNSGTLMFHKDFSYSTSSPTILSQASSTTTLTPVIPIPGPTPTAYPSNTVSSNVKPISDISWDSVSQTSSTSGYRDNYSFQTGILSPDDKSISQQSLLMLFEAQDEDTLI